MAGKFYRTLLGVAFLSIISAAHAGGRGPTINNNRAGPDGNGNGAGVGRNMEWFRQQPSPYASYSGAYADGYPAPEVQVVPEVRARAAAARQDYWRAYNHLNQVIRDQRRSFERSEEMQDALAAEKRAYQALQDARGEVLRSLAQDASYRAAIRLREETSQKIADRRTDDARVAPQDMVALATEKLSYATAARSRELALLTNNTEIEDRRAEFQEAAQRVAQLRAEFAEDLRVHPDLLAARSVHEETKAAYSVAAEYLESVVRARRIGLNYATNFYNFEPAYLRTGRVVYPY